VLQRDRVLGCIRKLGQVFQLSRRQRASGSKSLLLAAGYRKPTH